MTQFKQVVQAEQYAGKKVRFQAYVKTSGVRNDAGLWMRADSINRQAIALDNMDERRIKGTTDWQCYTIVLNIPKETVALHFGLLLLGEGRVWIDDCSIDIVSNDVWATAKPRNGYPTKGKTPARILNYPANLGFEVRAMSSEKK